MTALGPDDELRCGRHPYDSQSFFCESLTDATTVAPSERQSRIFFVPYEGEIEVLATALPRLDGWEITEAGQARLDKEE